MVVKIIKQILKATKFPSIVFCIRALIVFQTFISLESANHLFDLMCVFLQSSCLGSLLCAI